MEARRFSLPSGMAAVNEGARDSASKASIATARPTEEIKFDSHIPKSLGLVPDSVLAMLPCD